MSQRPLAVGMNLCEKVVIEAGTRNLTLVNCFNLREVTQLPSDPISFIVVVSLTDGQGQMPFELQVRRLADLEVIYEDTGTIQLTNPLNELRLRRRVVDLSFPDAGTYEVVLSVDSEAVAQRRFLIVLPEEEK